MAAPGSMSGTRWRESSNGSGARLDVWNAMAREHAPQPCWCAEVIDAFLQLIDHYSVLRGVSGLQLKKHKNFRCEAAAKKSVQKLNSAGFISRNFGALIAFQ